MYKTYSYIMSYHNASRFVHSNRKPGKNNRYGQKRPYENYQGYNNPPNPSFQDIAYGYQNPSGNVLGINVNSYGYGGAHPLGATYSEIQEFSESGHAYGTYNEPPKKIAGLVNDVFSKISEKFLDKPHNTSSHPSATNNNNILPINKFQSRSNKSFIPSKPTNNSINYTNTVSRNMPKINDAVIFKKPATPAMPIKAPIKVPVPIPAKTSEVKPKHVSAKDMWEISYTKEIAKDNSPKVWQTKHTEEDPEDPDLNGDEVINIVPITEDTSFIFTGVYDWQKSKIESEVSIKECKLCKAKFDSALNAKNHYTGRKHSKSLLRFFTEPSADSEPGFGFDVDIPFSKSNVEVAKFDKNSVCKLCNVLLESEAIAKSHFESKKHRKNVQDFLKIDADVIDVPLKDPATLPTNTPPCLSWDEIAECENSNTVRICRLCSVKMSSLISAKDHYSGKSHKKKIRMAETNQLPTTKKFRKTNFVSGGTLSMESDRRLYEQYLKACSENKNSSIFGAEATWLKPSVGNYANCMTPSGLYYCSICNITTSSMLQLQDHNNSRQHKLAKSKLKSPYQ